MSTSDLDLRRRSCLEDLEGKIGNAMKRKDSPEEAFCCYTDIKPLWKHQQLSDIFSGASLSESQRTMILKHLLRFLSFVVYARVADLVWYSTSRKYLFFPPDSDRTILTDDDLPLSQEALERLGFRRPIIERTWQYQYNFIPAVLNFSISSEVQQLGPRIRFPFEFRADRSERGGFGVVEFYRVSPEYIENRLFNNRRWRPEGAYAVAVKSFRDHHADAKKEVENLCVVSKKLATHSHHITLHHAILERTHELYIVLPLADLGNLHQLLRSESAIATRSDAIVEQSFIERFPELNGESSDLAIAMLGQCIAIAEALKFLHEGFHEGTSHVYLAHMDLKPDNILIFRERNKKAGTWKLADFGISVIKEVSNTGPGRRTMNTKARRPQSTYQAPEVQMSYQYPHLAKVGRKSDIWSFGTILAEILAFVEGGPLLLKSFGDERSSGPYDTFYEEMPRISLSPYNTGFQVRDEVSKWLRQRQTRTDQHTNAISCWSHTIERLLVIEPEERPDAKGLLDMIEHLFHHAHVVSEGKNCYCTMTSMETRALSRSSQADVQRSESSTVSLQHSPRVTVLSYTQSHLPSGTRSNSRAFNNLVTPSVRQDFLSDQTMLGTTGTSVDQNHIARPSSIDSVTDIVQSSANSHANSLLSQQDSMSSKSDTPTQDHSIMSDFGSPTVKLWQSSWKSPVKLAGSVSFTIGREWIAYLTKLTVKLFRIRPGGNEHNVVQSPISIDLPAGNNEEWLSIAIAGNWLVVWGVAKRRTSPKSLLRVFHLDADSWNVVPYQPILGTPFANDLNQFDYEKRVAISSQGFIGIVNSTKIMIINMNDPGNVIVRQLMMECESEFTDVAFNEHGDLLYAWAVGQQASCFCFGITGTDAGSSRCTGRYDWDWNQKMDQAQLYPLARQRGCLVVPNAGHVFLARFDHVFSSTGIVSMPNTPARHPTSASAQLRTSEMKAISIFNDHVFITIKGSLIGKAHVNEFRVLHQERQTVGSLTKLCDVQTSLKKGVHIKATRYENHRLVLIIICDLEGRMEIIKFGSVVDTVRSRRSIGR